jgi:hypothetical protein
MNGMAILITAIKLNRPEPRFETLMVQPFFDGLKKIRPNSIFDHCAHSFDRPNRDLTTSTFELKEYKTSFPTFEVIV